MTHRTIHAAVALICATAVAVLPASSAHADEVRDKQWHLEYLRIADAHKISQGDGVTVAVIDTGVNRHPDLEVNLLEGISFDRRTKDDGDYSGHGTRMAGLIGAYGRGTKGALGIAPKAKILPIRVQLGTTQATDQPDEIAAAIDYAIDQEVDVINLSLTATSSEIRRSIEKAIASNIVVVAGVGNRPADLIVNFPAAYNGVVAVGAAGRGGNRAEVSVTGPEVMILAPGDSLTSTEKDGGYGTGTGTSNATAIVSGAAALIRSKYPDLSAEEVIHRLTATAVDKGMPGRDEEYGYGVLDVVAALTADVPPLQGATPSAAVTQPDPSNNSNTLPDTESKNSSTTTLFIALAVLALLAIAGLIRWLVRRSRSPSSY